MLDTGRHFMPYADVIAFLDLLAMHKYNTFHLHLTEDQGWRFESKKYPQLTEHASSRAETKNPYWESGDGTPHGGYYTQDQLRAIVAYAAQRGITVVPEIEFPGHVRAMLAAFPQLGNHPDRQAGAATTWGIFPEVLNMTDASLEFAFDIWEEVLEIFPSTYIHVGGDECPRDEWRESEATKKLAAERGLPDARPAAGRLGRDQRRRHSGRCDHHGLAGREVWRDRGRGRRSGRDVAGQQDLLRLLPRGG
jgi:hexosaminidase